MGAERAVGPKQLGLGLGLGELAQVMSQHSDRPRSRAGVRGTRLSRLSFANEHPCDCHLCAI